VEISLHKYGAKSQADKRSTTKSSVANCADESDTNANTLTCEVADIMVMVLDEIRSPENDTNIQT
jgi:hypothetical protein